MVQETAFRDGAASVSYVTVDLVNEVLDKKGVRLSTDLLEGELPIKGNVGKLQQVVMNLITNARDATEEQIQKQATDIHKAFDANNDGIVGM